MVKHTIKGVVYAPLYIHNFQPLMPHNSADAEKFIAIDPDKLTRTADKLRYYRYKKALLQRDIADYAGLDRSTYIRYENSIDYYPPDKLAKIAELLNVDIIDLMDDYNTFLYNGQGKQIKALRKRMGLTQKEFSKYFSVHEGTVKKWEGNRIRIFKSTWERLFF